MDATLKRRMWKVAIVHVILTVLLVAIFIYIYKAASQNSVTNSATRHDIFFGEHSYLGRELIRTGLVVALLLQPLAFVVDAELSNTSLGDSVPSWVKLTILSMIALLWSYCFGWIFIRTKDWLTHFPALGRKIF